jgi:hypothetical protein
MKARTARRLLLAACPLTLCALVPACGGSDDYSPPPPPAPSPAPSGSADASAAAAKLSADMARSVARWSLEAGVVEG